MRRFGDGPDKSRRGEPLVIDRAGRIQHASPRARRWLLRLGLLDAAGPTGDIGPDWTRRLWQLALQTPPAGGPAMVPLRLGLRRALVVVIESSHDGQIAGSMQIVRTRPDIDALWWSILGDGL